MTKKEEIQKNVKNVDDDDDNKCKTEIVPDIIFSNKIATHLTLPNYFIAKVVII